MMINYDDMFLNTEGRAKEQQAAAAASAAAALQNEAERNASQIRELQDLVGRELDKARDFFEGKGYAVQIRLFDHGVVGRQPMLMFALGYVPDPMRLDQQDQYASSQVLFQVNGGRVSAKFYTDMSTHPMGPGRDITGSSNEEIIGSSISQVLDAYTLRHPTAK